MAKAKRLLIDKNIEKFISNNFDKKDRKKAPSLHFEWFANSMHIWHCSSKFFNSDTKIGKKMTLGNSEGCDAFFISVNNYEKIFTLNDDIDEVLDFLKKEGKLITFHFIQTKHSTNIGWAQYLHLFEIPLKIWNGLDFDNSQKYLKSVQEFIDTITDDTDDALKKIEHRIEITFYTVSETSYIEELEKKSWKTNIDAKIAELSKWFSKDNIKTNIRGCEFLNEIYEKLNSNEYELIVDKNNVIAINTDKYLIGYITAKELLNCISPKMNNPAAETAGYQISQKA